MRPSRVAGLIAIILPDHSCVAGDLLSRCELTVDAGEVTLGDPPEEDRMAELTQWRHMRTAPRDGSRILVTIRPSEQGPGAVDLAYWSNGDQYGGEAWRSSDSAPGRIIEYAEPELKCWMPMPPANVDQFSMPPAWEGKDDVELDGSGI